MNDKNETESFNIKYAAKIVLVLLGWGFVMYGFSIGMDKLSQKIPESGFFQKIADGEFFQKDSWIAFYYPDGPGSLIEFDKSQELSSLKECRQWVENRADSLMDDEYDYECGLNCKPSRSIGDLMVCEETLD